MNAKDIENKVKALYKNVEPNNFLKSDTKLIKDAIHSDRIKQQINKQKEDIYNECKLLVRSPAKNLMYLYDKHAEILNKTFLPSTIYHYRYEHQYPDFDKQNTKYKSIYRPGINEYLKERLCYRINTDSNSYYKGAIFRGWDWLNEDLPETYQEWCFDNYWQVKTFFKKHLNTEPSITEKHFLHKTHPNELVKLNGKNAGWVILRVL